MNTQAFGLSGDNTGLAAQLERELEEQYTMPNTPGAHDVLHVRRLIAFGPAIAAATGLQFDPDEFAAAAWLHNIDRIEAYRGVDEVILEQAVRRILASLEHRFSPDAEGRIVDVVLQHNKKDDEPDDSPLLSALRIADKIDRLGPLGIISAAAFRGPDFPLYDPHKPFGYGTTVEGRMRVVYQDFFRVLEWVGMLPSDQARSLINRDDLANFVNFLRALGREIARRHGVENDVEEDIRSALGPYYEEWARSKFLSHVVMIKFHDTTSETQRQAIYDRYQTIAEDCGGREAGILYFEIEHNLDQRKGWHLVEVAWFRNDDALQAFRIHPKHTELTNELRQIADWVVGDFMAELPTI